MIVTGLASAPALAAGALGGGLAIAALALLMSRDARALPILAVLALPFRLPVSADGRTVNLLLPLYAVVAAGTLVHLLPRLAPAGTAGGWLARWRSLAYAPAGPPIALDWLLLATVVLYALQSVYSSDLGKAAENLAFFYLPFGLLYLLLRDAPWTRQLLLACLGVAAGLAVLFAGVGFVEYYRKALFLNPKVIAANEYGNYFRVNSLFFDPSIYGRFLAMVMIAITTVVLWARERREQWLGAAALGWLLLGLATSFSQSSIAALLLGLAVLAAWRWDLRATVYVSAALAAIALVVVLVAPTSLHFGLKGSGGSANNATNGRAKLISGGLKLFADRSLYGFGSGSFETQYKRHGGGTTQNATSASHTIPITVAAEQGVLGLALYLALIVVALLTLFRGAGRSPPSPKPGDTRLRAGWAGPFRIAIAACFAALVLHTWVYADFLEDPITWTLLGIGVALSIARVPAAAESELACATT
ncbi:MAG TPA: O-antigen ligase family protein [Solirubrobacteraceae bacterium]|nr:O-antigen ligase family protein [Solirubrobacteraceae bacterium]